MTSMSVVNEGISLHVEVDGEGPTILLLHGWPDTGSLWDEVAFDLVREGYRVALPDLRGCGASEKPEALEQYRMTHLVSDVIALIEALAVERVTLVGHDWGAALAWAVASRRPDLLERLVVVSVGHPTAFRTAGLKQQVMSWYTLLFFHEGVGEGFLRKNDYEAMRHWLHHPRVEQVIEELERDGQMSAHLRWYRANLPPSAFLDEPPVLAPIDVPVLGLWSSGDLGLTEVQMTGSAPYCSRGFTYVRFERYGHWLPIEAPHEVSREIVNFLTDGPSSTEGTTS